MKSLIRQINDIKEQARLNDAAGLMNVNDPDKVYANILRDDYATYINNFREYEKRLLDMTDSEALIDRSRENAKNKDR